VLAAVEDVLGSLGRPVRLLAAGGTIAMQGERAVPSLDAEALVHAVPPLAVVPQLSAETVLALPGPQLELTHALALAKRAREVAHGGEGVVITTGTDTLEELAVVCAMTYDADAPIVITGANRPASRPGADGPANLLDAVALAGSDAGAGLGTVVVFGGEIHAAMSVRKVDSTGPAAFGSPASGPLGRIVEGRIWLHARPLARRVLALDSLSYRVPVITAVLGDDGELLRTASLTADGLVVAVLGAGHLPPGMLHALREAAARLPALLTCRVERASMLFATYGFEGAEADLRSSGAVCVPFLSAPAARMALLCCLGAGLDVAGIRDALAPWDARLDFAGR
jgi:L-asparaginase